MPLNFITKLLGRKQKQEITGDKDQTIHKKPRPYDEIDNFKVDDTVKNQTENGSSPKEITGDKDQTIHKKPRPYDEIDNFKVDDTVKNQTENGSSPKAQKKQRQYDDVDIVDEPKNQIENESAKAEPALNYIQVDIQPSSGATTKIVGSDAPQTQYSTIDIEATEKRKLSTQNAEET